MLHDFKLSNTPSTLDFDIHLDPGKRLYCFIGENGVGKTSLLEGLAAVLFAGHAMWQRQDSAEGSYVGLLTKSFMTDVGSRRWAVPDAEVNNRAVKRGSWGVSPFNLLGSNLSLSPVDRPLIFAPSLSRATVAPLLAEAIRLSGSVTEDFTDSLTRNLDAIERKPVDTSELGNWLASRLIVDPNFVVGLRRPHHQVATLLSLLEHFDPAHFGGVVKAMPDGRVHFDVAFHAVDATLRFRGAPIDRLASGYIALLKIFQEIVASVAAWEGVRNRTDLLATDALVLIDEIDAHLHPRWQAKLLPFLKESFPNATFVVTTHSPIMVQSTEAGEAYELVKDGRLVTSRRLGSPRDWYWNDVLEEAFHVELPLPGEASGDGQPALVDELLELTTLVHRFTSDREEAVRDQAIALYERIRPRLLDDDPRRSSLEELRRHLA